jgi:hypothetical protein
MNNMTDYYQRVRAKFDKGEIDGKQGVFKPGRITGAFRRAYTGGYRRGLAMRGQIRALTDFKK